MKVNSQPLVLFLSIFLIISACVVQPTNQNQVSLPTVASVSPKKTAQPVVPTSTKAPAPVNTKAPAPTPTQAVQKLESVDVNCEPDLVFFTYNPDVWTARVNERITYSKKTCYELVLNSEPTCVIGQFLGHGAIPVTEETKTYAGIPFLIYRWKNQDSTWKAMSVKWDNYQHYFNVDLTDFDSPCWSKVEEVLTASAKLKFKP